MLKMQLNILYEADEGEITRLLEDVVAETSESSSDQE